MTAPLSSLADHADERFTEAQRSRLAEFDAASNPPETSPVVRAVLAVAAEWDTKHSGWCCTQSCPEPDGRHHDPTDPVSLNELAGMWSDNPPPLVEHRTLPCPGACTCQVGPYIADLRSAISAVLDPS